MDARVTLAVLGIFFFGVGILLLIMWSGSVRIFISTEQMGSGHSFAGEILALVAPPMLSIAFGALLFYLRGRLLGIRAWRKIAGGMLLAGGFSLVLQFAYPIYFALVSGIVLQIFPGIALSLMAVLIAVLQPFARRNGAHT